MCIWIVGVLRSCLCLMVMLVGCIMPSSTYPYMCHVILWCLGCSSAHCDRTNMTTNKRYLDIVNTNEKAVIVFNHPTPWDHLVIMANLHTPVRFVAKSNYLIGITRWIAKKLGCIMVQPNGGTADVIKTAIETRRATEALVAIAPSGGYTCEDPCILPKFRSGAFVSHESYIIPIVLRYWPYERWHDQTLAHVIWRRLVGSPLSYCMDILEEMRQETDEEPERFRQRVQTAMERALSNVKPVDISANCNRKSRLLACTSGMLFGTACLYTWKIKRLFLETYGILWVTCISIWYHTTGWHHARFVDMLGNFVLSIFFSINSLFRQNVLPCVFALIAGYGYSFCKNESDIEHMVFVHIPVWLGLLAV